MMSKIMCRATVLALSLSTACAVHAGENDFSYRLSGFGTAGYAETNTNDALFTNPAQLKGVDKNGSALLDSRIGGQLDLTFNKKLSATVQALAQQDAKGKFMPQLEWAFLRYKLSDSLTMRVGQLGWPAYLVSDFRYVGYSNPWLRTPLEVYDLAPLDSYQGADLSWTHGVGGGFLTLEGLAGHASSPLPETTDVSARVKVNQLVGVYATYEIGSLRLRGGLSTGKVTYDSGNTAALFGGLQMTGFGAIAQALDANNSRTTFISLGGTYDANNILVTGEYAKLNSSRLLGHASGWYGTFGYRLGNVMPYVTYAGYVKQDGSAINTVPAFGPLIPLSIGVESLAQGNSQHTASFGVRWDVHSNVAIKVQFDHVLPSAHGGDFTQVTPSFNGHAVNVYSAVVDFVF